MALVSSRTIACPACNAPNTTCTSPGHVNSDDMVDLSSEEHDMSDNEKKPLKSYDVVYNGFKTRMKLSEEDAKRLGGTPPSDEPAPAQAKARTAPNK